MLTVSMTDMFLDPFQKKNISFLLKMIIKLSYEKWNKWKLFTKKLALNKMSELILRIYFLM